MSAKSSSYRSFTGERRRCTLPRAQASLCYNHHERRWFCQCSGNPAENLGCEACFYKRRGLSRAPRFLSERILGGRVVKGVRGHANHHPPPLPSCTRTINARNRTPPVAGVSFGAPEAPGKTFSVKEGLPPSLENRGN